MDKIITIRGAEEYRNTFCTESTENFLRKVLPPFKTHHLSKKEMVLPEIKYRCRERNSDWARETRDISRLFLAAHHAFQTHTPFTISPKLFWYVIGQEIFTVVDKQPADYAALFAGDRKEKIKIEARDDSLVYGEENDWTSAIALFKAPLKKKLANSAYDVFMPPFSTLTPEEEAALLISFMNVVSHYCEYTMFTMCGIPRIKLEGTPEDWTLLVDHTRELAKLFPVLSAYFGDLIPVLEKIQATAKGDSVDERFWKSIYKYNDESGQPHVSGWLTALTAFEETKDKGKVLKEAFHWQELYKKGWASGHSTGSFPTHATQVPFIWNYYGKEIPMALVSGVLGVSMVDGFLTPQLGFGVIEPGK